MFIDNVVLFQEVVHSSSCLSSENVEHHRGSLARIIQPLSRSPDVWEKDFLNGSDGTLLICPVVSVVVDIKLSRICMPRIVAVSLSTIQDLHGEKLSREGSCECCCDNSLVSVACNLDTSCTCFFRCVV